MSRSIQSFRPRTMENLVTKWGNMSLDEREGGEVQLNENESSKNVTSKFFVQMSTEYRICCKDFQSNLEAEERI